MNQKEAIEVLRLHSRAIEEMEWREKQPEGIEHYAKIRQSLQLAISALQEEPRVVFVEKPPEIVMVEKQAGDSKITPEQLHKWYLEAICYLDNKDYNERANRHYETLTEGQKFIDKYIADKINSQAKNIAQALKSYIKDKIQQCLTQNDSDTHIICVVRGGI